MHAVSQLPAVVYARLLPRLGQGAHDASVVPSHAVAVVPAAHTAVEHGTHAPLLLYAPVKRCHLCSQMRQLKRKLLKTWSACRRAVGAPRLVRGERRQGARAEEARLTVVAHHAVAARQTLHRTEAGAADGRGRALGARPERGQLRPLVKAVK